MTAQVRPAGRPGPGRRRRRGVATPAAARMPAGSRVSFGRAARDIALGGLVPGVGEITSRSIRRRRPGDLDDVGVQRGEPLSDAVRPPRSTSCGTGPQKATAYTTVPTGPSRSPIASTSPGSSAARSRVLGHQPPST
ncbi:hypothetical protein K7G98_18210 [Saccharothrix sp. MB29]|nr:hypothetical protein [Saccharothrix sp. MB29]